MSDFCLMRAIVQRVEHASVEIDARIHAAIGNGLLLLVGFESEDNEDDLQWMARKVTEMRIFNDDDGRMNNSAIDVQGHLLIISQFTLHASTKKGNRPSFIKAAKPEIAIPLYKRFKQICESKLPCKSGIFGADMKVSLVNSGPVTISLDSKMKG